VRVRFWGTRGSIPASLSSDALRQKLTAVLLKAVGKPLDSVARIEAFVTQEIGAPYTFGGDSSCVQIDVGGAEYILCDLGSGARAFGNHVLATHGPRAGNTFHVLMSHLHWDHIMGFPFFPPVYIPGNTIRIYGCHGVLEEAFRRQHAAPSFPVDFSQLDARIEFVRIETGRPYDIGGLRVRAMKQRHGGDSYGYRFEHAGRAVVYSTDSEHKLEDPSITDEFVAFFKDADLVIFDAMYSLADAVTVKEDWGHSSNVVGVELCQMARAKHLCLFHHDPNSDDEKLAGMLRDTRRFEEITRGDLRLEVSAAFDGMELVV
jgi:phosphoribosyl 1,2-cyclic phosphodiesterase